MELTDELREQFIEWLAGQGYSTTDDERGWRGPKGQCGLSRCHMRKHVQRFFPRLSSFVEPGKVDGYITAALAKRAWSSVQHECLTLRLFLQFSAARRWIVNPPSVPDPPETAMGVRDPRRKAHATDLSPEQWEALLGQLPEHAARARREGGRLTPIRDAVTLQYELMRRPVTVERLRKGEHWRPEHGARICLTADIDKNGKRRARRGEKAEWIALSPRAHAIVKQRAAEVRDGELIIGPYQATVRSYVQAAALAIGLPADVAKHVSLYDGRHNAIRHAVDETGDLRGVSAQCGTGIASLAKHYLDSGEKQATRMVAKRAGAALARASASQTAPELVRENGLPQGRPSKCEGGDSNPHRSYPTSTSS